MSAYIYSAVCVSLFVALICAAAPRSQGIEKFVAFIGALALSLTVLSPLVKAEELGGLFSREESGAGEKTEQSSESDAALAQYYARCAAESMSAMYGLSKDKISVDVTVSAGEVSKIDVKVDGYLLSDKEAEERLSEILGIETEVSDSGG